MFFVLSGYLWKRRPFAEDARARLKTLAIPYAAWFCILAVPFFAIRAVADGGHSATVDLVKSAWGGSLAGRPFTAFWFFSALLLALLTLRGLQRFPLWVSLAVSTVALVACHAEPRWVARSPLALGQALACIIFVLIGRALRHTTTTYPGQSAQIGPWLVLVGLIAAMTILTRPMDQARRFRRTGRRLLWSLA